MVLIYILGIANSTPILDDLGSIGDLDVNGVLNILGDLPLVGDLLNVKKIQKVLGGLDLPIDVKSLISSIISLLNSILGGVDISLPDKGKPFAFYRKQDFGRYPSGYSQQ